MQFAIVSFISAGSYSLCQYTLHVEVVVYKKENNVIYVAAGFSEQVYMYELTSLLCIVKKCTFLGYEDIRVISGHVSYITDSCDLSECE